MLLVFLKSYLDYIIFLLYNLCIVNYCIMYIALKIVCFKEVHQKVQGEVKLG